MIARHFMYKQVYLHHIRRVYDIHLKDFLQAWLPGRRFSTKLKKHLNIADVEVLVAIRKAYEDKKSAYHDLARRIQCREHFRRFYEASPPDIEGGKLQPGKEIFQAAVKQFGDALIRHDYMLPKAAAPNFPVLAFDGKVESSLKRSQILEKMPAIGLDTVYCDRSIRPDAIAWVKENKNQILGLG
jgi:hypothetical protein